MAEFAFENLRLCTKTSGSDCKGEEILIEVS